MKKEFIFKLALILVVFLLVYQFGVSPLISKDFYFKVRENNTWAKGKLPKDGDIYDVVVIGEEADGIAAALSSSRAGAKTLLISETQDLGGTFKSSLYTDFVTSRNSKGEKINRGFVSELYSRLGEGFNIGKYVKTVDELVKDEKNLKVVYGAKLGSPVLDGDTITGINIYLDGKSVTYNGRIFIDATHDGSVLVKCGVPYFYGSGDINLDSSFAPALLNFEVDGVKWSEAKPLIEANSKEFYTVLGSYETSSANVRINGFNIIDEGNDRIIIQAMEVYGVDFRDSSKTKEAYREAVKEAENFIKFLSTRFSVFKNAKFYKAADSFYMKEFRHFKGEYTLSINDVLANKDFADKIAMGSAAVDGAKLADNSRIYIMGKPDQYGIPLGCIIPLKIDNLLMTGSKISYSSLASLSAGAFDTSLATGEAAGVVAVYSVMKNIKPRELVREKDTEKVEELERLLKRQGMYLPVFNLQEKDSSNWAFPAVKQLRSLGLVAGGAGNDYKYNREATTKDLAMLLLNGIYRLAPEMYSLELDARLRPYFKNDKLTKDMAGKILNDLNDVNIDIAGAYDKACDLGYINNEIQLKLTKPVDKKVLTMDEVYVLAVYNIRLFTGKDIPG